MVWVFSVLTSLYGSTCFPDCHGLLVQPGGAKLARSDEDQG